MKKLVKLFAVCVMLIVTTFCLTACASSGNTNVADYVNVYTQYLNDEPLTKTVSIGTSFWTDSEGRMGAYNVDSDNNKIHLFATNGEEVVEIYTASKDGGNWVISQNGTATFKVKTAEKADGCNGNVSTYIIFGVLIAAVIALFIWSSVSNKKKQKKAQEAVRSLKVGDRVKTIGGVCGFVAEIDDMENTFVLEVKAKGTSSFVKFDKGAIYQSAPASGNDSSKKEEKPEEVKEEVKAEEKKPAKKTSARKSVKKEVEDSATIEEVKAEEKSDKE